MKDTLIFGNIYTMDSAKPHVEAIGIRGGKVAFAGSRDEAYGFDAKEVLDFGGNTVLPGFIDTHVHVIPSGIFMTSADLSGAASIADVLRLIREHAAAGEGKGWILAAFFQDKLIEEKRFPTRRELDAISDQRPILICHNDLHPIALNSKALDLLKVDPAKEGVGTDANGELTGIIEDPA